MVALRLVPLPLVPPVLSMSSRAAAPPIRPGAGSGGQMSVLGIVAFVVIVAVLIYVGIRARRRR